MVKEKKKRPYNPLPEYLSIGPSDIHEAGILAKEDIPAEVVIGISHVYDTNFQHNYIRTPLGGFINHSDTPNCHKVQSHEDSTLTYYILQTIKDIKKGEELTVTYTIYNVKPIYSGRSFKVAKGASCPAEGVL